MIKKVAIVGTQGVPANYGGFESLVDNLLGENCPDGVQYTVFCSSRDLPDRRSSYKGATLKYIPLHANGAQSIPYDILSMCRCMRGYDAVLVLGVSGCLFLPVLKTFGRSRIIVNIDGLEHRRAKWGPVARRVLRMSEAVAVRTAHVVIADNKGIQDYVAQTYARPAALVAYGGDHAMRSISEDFAAATLARYGLRKDGYAITVCRIEPENNSDIILEAFSRMPERQLVFIGNWNHSEWARGLKAKYAGCTNMLLIDAIYDLDVLYALRSSAAVYLHGHSAGGTNPSLVEAMCLSRPVVAFDVVYNRETTEGRAAYFSDADSLVEALRGPLPDGGVMFEIARRRYTWRHISQQYASLY